MYGQFVRRRSKERDDTLTHTIGGRKQCTRCHNIKSLDAFSRLRENKDGRREACKECCKEYNARYFAQLSPEKRTQRLTKDKKWKQANKERLRKSWFKGNLKKYGLTLIDYEQMLLSQSALCAICHKEETCQINGRTLPLAIDHNHSTGAVRGLLCSKCNKALGGFNDSVELLLAAIDYLHKYDHGGSNGI
jgi:hypothetical protein